MGGYFGDNTCRDEGRPPKKKFSKLRPARKRHAAAPLSWRFLPTASACRNFVLKHDFKMIFLCQNFWLSPQKYSLIFIHKHAQKFDVSNLDSKFSSACALAGPILHPTNFSPCAKHKYRKNRRNRRHIVAKVKKRWPLWELTVPRTQYLSPHGTEQLTKDSASHAK